MFTFKVLGAPVLTGPQGPVTGRAAYRRRMALLAVLAVARGRPVGRERLIGLLWPEHTDDAARHNLSESLYVLRKELGEGIASSGDEVRLDPAVVTSDVGEFEAALERGELEAAARVYGGPLLEGFYVADAPEFERWVEGERDRLGRAYARALERLAEAAEAEGSALRAVDWWRALAVHDPYASRVALRLVRAYDAAGERAAALRYAGTHAALLREELGVDGDPELEALVERLRTEPVRTPAPPPPPRFTVGAAAAAGTASPPPPPDAPSLTAGVDAAPSSPPADAPPEAEPAAEEGSSPVETRAAEGGTAAADDVAVEGRGAADAAPRIDPGDRPPELAGDRGGAHPAPPPTHPAGPARARRPVPAAARLAGVLGVAAGLLLAAVARPAAPRGQAADGAAAGYDPRRIAVLYFDDNSPGEELRYLAGGLTESLIHELSQVEALEVISRNGVKPYRDRPAPFDSLVRALRVGSVVEGSLQRAGDSVLVTVQLVDAATEAHLESRQVQAPLGDVVGLERAVAQEVAASLRRRLGAELRLREVRAETRSARALALVLQAEQARADARRLQDERDPLDAASAVRLLSRADSLLARAGAEDPAWARPAVQRGWVAVALARHDAAHADTLLAAALRRADGVLARHPADAQALELRGTVVFHRVVQAVEAGGQPRELDRAERDLRAAVAADPSLASAWSRLSQLLRYRGRFAEADLAARRALQEDAYLDDAADVLHSLYNSALALGDYRAAAAWCERGRREFPADWRLLECRLTLMREDPAQAQDPALAWRLVAALDSVDPPARAAGAGRAYSPLYRRMVAASVSARAGDAARARAEVARARAAVGGDADLRLSLAYDEAYVRLRLGERDAARRLLDELVAARPPLGPYLRRDPLFRELFTPSASRSR